MGLNLRVANELGADFVHLGLGCDDNGISKTHPLSQTEVRDNPMSPFDAASSTNRKVDAVYPEFRNQTRANPHLLDACSRRS
jgi:hypothetical protein